MLFRLGNTEWESRSHRMRIWGNTEWESRETQNENPGKHRMRVQGKTEWESRETQNENPGKHRMKIQRNTEWEYKLKIFACLYLFSFVVRSEDKKCKSLKEKQAKLFGKYNLSETQLGTLAVWQTYGNQDNCRPPLHQYWSKTNKKNQKNWSKLRKNKTKLNKTKKIYNKNSDVWKSG